jgi:hypothetical protein
MRLAGFLNQHPLAVAVTAAELLEMGRSTLMQKAKAM